MSGDLDLWLIDRPWLAGGANPDDAGIAALHTMGFAAVVCLLDPTEQAPCYDPARASAQGFERHTLPICDFTAPGVDQCRAFVALIEDLRQRGRLVFVHCQGGLGRTGTMAAIALVARGLSATEAIARVRAVRSGAIETPAQEAAIRAYAKATGV